MYSGEFYQFSVLLVHKIGYSESIRQKTVRSYHCEMCRMYQRPYSGAPQGVRPARPGF